MDDPRLYLLARDICHEAGLPWTDPRTGRTYPPPRCAPDTNHTERSTPMDTTTVTAPDEPKAAPGERMIELRVRFWTDGLAHNPGHVIPKHAWTSGMVHVTANDSHDLHAGQDTPFNSLLDLPGVIAQVLREHGIVLHPSQRDKKFLAP